MEEVKKKIKRHQAILSDFLEKQADLRNNALGSLRDCQPIIDLRHNHFQLTRIGWHERKHHFNVLMHFEIKADGKIWIHQNATEVLVGEALEALGVAKNEIVVGFRPEYLRPMTGYATA